MIPRKIKYVLVLLLIGWLASCTPQRQTQAARSPSSNAPNDVHLLLNISKRKLFVFNGDAVVRTYPVAVGQPKYPTPVGHFKIHRIDWNPEWNPPLESDWTKDKSYTPPGDPENPMGRVRIVYQMPYTIHGTKEIASLGKAQSHGSVRMANEDVIELAKFLMAESGTAKPQDWYDDVLAQPNKMVSVKLINEVPLMNIR